MTKVTYREALALLDLEGLPSADVVRRAFRREALKWHPDKAVAAASSQPSDGSTTSLDSNPATATATTGGAASSASAPPETSSQPTSPQLATAPRLMSREAAEERFKRLAAAYHLLLRAADGAAALLLAPGHDGVGVGTTGDGGGAAASRDGGYGDQVPSFGHDGFGPGGCGLDVDLDDEALADALSADLLLEARRLRLSDFDMVFLHQRASVGSAGLAPEWSDAVRDVDDLWRRIRRRLERRRQRRQQQAACAQAGLNGSGKAASDCFGPAGPPGGACSTVALAAGSKWSLLFEFMADVVGAEAPGSDIDCDEEHRDEGGIGEAGGSGGEATEASLREVARGGRGGHAEVKGRCGGDAAMAAEARAGSGTPPTQAAQLPQERRRGRLPPGFYWRWLRRFVALQILIGVLFKR
ncbi:hypothetical protein CHLRE_13g582900v5 [Chlamydomonas reinhardtii]|uniref:J domain-containing protein n=1 Tax=Chlamydomonas reinhardtii TaxID=3055 RepID=A0A2K3D0L4_CHLRE|nr:uncharacterized protein CHLRE_13g582900v5 [Chlamydomonas reinhardtii]PNW74039.1 hypothetical protein CHLRE_13g582900v5 [Chlamydomonas reinhardtii]